MKFVRNDSGSWQEYQGYSKRVLIDEDELQSPGSKVQLLKIKPGETAKDHFHKIQTEVFYFLSENGYFVVNQKKIQPQIGDVLVVEPNDVHSVVNESGQDYVYVCFKIKYDKDDLYWVK